jgi:hypothetical protein
VAGNSNSQKSSAKKEAWTNSDVIALVTVGKSCTNPKGRVDRKQLKNVWDGLRATGTVSAAERSADALVLKYRSIEKSSAGVQVGATMPNGPDEPCTSTLSQPTLTGRFDKARVEGSSTGRAVTMASRERPNHPASPVMSERESSDTDDRIAQEHPYRELGVDESVDLRCMSTGPANETEGIPEIAERASTSPATRQSGEIPPVMSVELDYDEFAALCQQVLEETRTGGPRLPLRPLRNSRIPDRLVQFGNEWLKSTLVDGVEGDSRSFTRLNCAVYTVAKVVTECSMKSNSGESTKVWLKENHAKILLLSQNLGKLNDIIGCLKGNKSLTQKQSENLRHLRRVYGRRYKLRTMQEMDVLYRDLVQHLAKSRKLRKVKLEEIDRKRTRWAPLSCVFRSKDGNEDSTPVDSVRDYWEGVIGHAKTFTRNRMTDEWAKECQDKLTRQKADQVLGPANDLATWRHVCKRARPWKAAGPDGIHNFWWKALSVANEELFRHVISFRRDENYELPKWVSRGRAVSLYKGTGDKKDPGNYRTIACLNTCYKLITGTITRWIQDELEKTETGLPGNQVALKKDVWGLTLAHTIDRTIVVDAKHRRHAELSVCWVDFAKAFDSVPHDYIRFVLETVGIGTDLRSMIFRLMSNWELTYEGFENGRLRKSRPLRVVNGVLQGDTLSPILFGLCVAPVSHYLNTNLPMYVTAHGTIGGRVTHNALVRNHTYFVDDLVTYCRIRSELERVMFDLMSLVNEIGMSVNPKKSAFYHLNEEPAPSNEGDEPGDRIPTLGLMQTYKYLGIEKSASVSHKEVWDRIGKEVMVLTAQIWSSNLTFGQKVRAFNAKAIPKAKFYFTNIIIGAGKFASLVQDAIRLDEAVRTLLVREKARHRSSAVARLYLGFDKGGFGLQSFEQALYEATIYGYCYIATSPDLKPCFSLMRSLTRRNKRSIVSDFRHVLSRTQVDFDVEITDDPDSCTLTVAIRTAEGSDNAVVTVYEQPTQAARAIVNEVRKKNQETLWKEVCSLETAGAVFRNQDLDLDRSFLWLQKGLLSSGAVNNVIAAQEGQMLLRGHPMHVGTDQTCRLACSKLPARLRKETAEHVLSVCPHWRPSLMVKRHNSVALSLYNRICIETGFQTRHYNQTVEGVRSTEKYDLYWDHPIITVKKLKHNRPDIVLIDKERKRIFIVEISVSWVTNLLQQESRKKAKYQENSTLPEDQPLVGGHFPPGDNLACEMGRDWGYVVSVIPIVIGASGEVSRNLRDYLRKLPIPENKLDNTIERMQRSAVIGSAIILKAHCSVPSTQ